MRIEQMADWYCSLINNTTNKYSEQNQRSKNGATSAAISPHTQFSGGGGGECSILIFQNTHDFVEINNTNDDELEVHYLSSYIPPPFTFFFQCIYAMWSNQVSFLYLSLYKTVLRERSWRAFGVANMAANTSWELLTFFLPISFLFCFAANFLQVLTSLSNVGPPCFPVDQHNMRYSNIRAALS